MSIRVPFLDRAGKVIGDAEIAEDGVTVTMVVTDQEAISRLSDATIDVSLEYDRLGRKILQEVEIL